MAFDFKKEYKEYYMPKNIPEMHVFDRFEDTDLIAELLEGMYAELPEKKPKRSKD